MQCPSIWEVLQQWWIWVICHDPRKHVLFDWVCITLPLFPPISTSQRLATQIIFSSRYRNILEMLAWTKWPLLLRVSNDKAATGPDGSMFHSIPVVSWVMNYDGCEPGQESDCCWILTNGAVLFTSVCCPDHGCIVVSYIFCLLILCYKWINDLLFHLATIPLYFIKSCWWCLKFLKCIGDKKCNMHI